MIVIYISAKYLRVDAAADFIDRLLDLSTKRRKSESIDGLRLLGLRPLHRHFEALTRRIDRFMVWSFATTLTVGCLIVAALKLWL